MSRAWPMMPGVPAAGHVTGGGYWHPGKEDGCVKCEPRYAYEDPASLAWGAALVRKGLERKAAREAAEQRWAVIAHDGLGETVERTGADPDALADEVASWAQQEADKWPELGLIYMLVALD